jgi:LuxR family maltose regulon positive regulatory protein
MDDETSVSKWIDDLLELDFTNPIVVDLPVQVYYFLDKKVGEIQAAERHTEEYEFFSEQGLNTVLIKIRALQALNSNDPDIALDYLVDALRLAKKKGHIRPFVDLGMPLTPLLREALSINIEKAYSRKLLDIIETEERQKKIRKAAMSTLPLNPGILSEREVEVLKLVAQGLSNQQIADRLTIGLSTVKTHVYHIFDKLEAKDRLQAVTVARELKLIE